MESSKALNIDINAKDGEKMTAFHWACIKGYSDVVKIFMDYETSLKIDLNAQNKKGQTAFHSAGFEVIKIFMDYGASSRIDPNAKEIIWPKETVCCQQVEICFDID